MPAAHADKGDGPQTARAANTDTATAMRLEIAHIQAGVMIIP
jgi:hypothetical protein